MATVSDNFDNAGNLNELLGSEVTGGELINEQDTPDVYDVQSRTTSNDLLPVSAPIENFDYTTGKKPGGTNGRVQFSVDGSAYTNKDGDNIDVGAYQFDQTNDYITVPGTEYDFSYSDDFTICTWAYSDDWSNQRGGAGQAASLFSHGQDNNRFDLSLNYDAPRFMFFTDGGTNSSISSEELVNGQWYHVAATYNGTSRLKTLYVNGREVNSQTAPAQDFYVAGNNNIGRSNYAGIPAYFGGSLSDMRIYSEELSEATIWDLFAYATEPSTTNLEGHWKMDGGATDESVNGNDGTVSGAVNTTTWSDIPHLGHSLLTDDEAQTSSFDGVNDYVDIGTIAVTDDLCLASSNLTIAVWTNATLDGDISQRVVDKSDGGNGANGYVLYYNNDGSVGFAIDGVGLTSTAGDLTANRWHNVVATADGTNWKIYVDNVEVATTADTSLPPSVETNMRIGTWNHSTAREFEGSISNLAIFNDALTVAEIETLFLLGCIPTGHDHIISMWKLNGDYLDAVGSKDGTNNGSTLINDIYRPQPSTPVERTIDISALGTSAIFNYRTYFDSISADNSYSLTSMAFDYTGGTTFIPKIMIY